MLDGIDIALTACLSFVASSFLYFFIVYFQSSLLNDFLLVRQLDCFHTSSLFIRFSQYVHYILGLILQENGRCEWFVYGGCRGNKNNFATPRECQDLCGGSEPLTGKTVIVIALVVVSLSPYHKAQQAFK